MNQISWNEAICQGIGFPTELCDMMLTLAILLVTCESFLLIVSPGSFYRTSTVVAELPKRAHDEYYKDSIVNHL